jgi:hypothetical protein
MTQVKMVKIIIGIPRCLHNFIPRCIHNFIPRDKNFIRRYKTSCPDKKIIPRYKTSHPGA